MRLLPALFVLLLACSQVGGQEAETLLDESILNLTQLESEFSSLNSLAERLQSLLIASQLDSMKLTQSLKVYQQQVGQQSKNYENLLIYSKNLKRSSDLKNWVIGGVFVGGLVIGLLLFR